MPSNRICSKIGDNSRQTAALRLKGYTDALIKHNLPIVNRLIIHSDLSTEKAKIYVHYFFEMLQPPDAIFAVNDPSTIQVILAARLKGIRIPEETGIVEFSDNPISSFIEPGLTTVSQPTLEIGRLAARKVLGSLAHDLQQDQI